MMRVGMNQLFRQRFQPAAGGDNLRQDFRAVPVLVQHPLHGVELADDFAHPDNRGAALFYGMVMFVFRHGATISGEVGSVKNGLTNKGYGGIR